MNLRMNLRTSWESGAAEGATSATLGAPMRRKKDASGRAAPSETLEARMTREAYNAVMAKERGARRKSEREMQGVNADGSEDEMQVEFPTAGATRHLRRRASVERALLTAYPRSPAHPPPATP